MNMSKAISAMKTSLGLQTIALPFDKPPELVLKETYENTISVFSKYKKGERKAVELISNLRYKNDNEKAMGIFYIPESLSRYEIYDCYAYPVSQTNWRRGETAINAFTVGSPFVGFGTYYPQDILNAVGTGAAINKYAGVTTNPPTSEWLGYNQVRLYNFPSDGAALFVATCEHDLSGETIPASQEEAFRKLWTLDAKRTLYAHLKNLDGLGSAYKEIKLKLEDWAAAEDKYWETLKEYGEVEHLDHPEDCIQFF